MLLLTVVDFIIEVSKTTGIILDPTYSGKAVYGFVQELNKNPKRFKGNRILYIHTGKGVCTSVVVLDSTVGTKRLVRKSIAAQLNFNQIFHNFYLLYKLE